MDPQKIEYYLLLNIYYIGSYYITWHKKPPAPSHMGKIQERQIS